MRILILGALITSSLIFNVSCSSNKKKAEAEATEMGGDISSKALEFDPAGSDSGKIEGLSTVYFGYDEASLNSSTKDLLSQNANWIKAKEGTTLQIEGHCDNRGSVEYNLALGERRAKAVKNYLVSLGVEPKKVMIISYGKEKPLDLGDSESAHSKNRRANFVPLPN